MKRSIGAVATLPPLLRVCEAKRRGSQRKSLAANDKVIIGVMGLGGRGTYLAEKFAGRPDAEIAYLCDADTRRFARARNVVEEVQDRKPKLVQNFRKILDDSSVDALINAPPTTGTPLEPLWPARRKKTFM